jgi:hypothetical protein
MDTVIGSFVRLRAEARERMSEEDFRQAEWGLDDLVRRVGARVDIGAQRLRPGSYLRKRWRV